MRIAVLMVLSQLLGRYRKNDANEDYQEAAGLVVRAERLAWLTLTLRPRAGFRWCTVRNEAAREKSPP